MEILEMRRKLNGKRVIIVETIIEWANEMAKWGARKERYDSNEIRKQSNVMAKAKDRRKIFKTEIRQKLSAVPMCSVIA